MKSTLFSRKTALLALLLAAALFLSGCNLVVKDPQVDAKQVIVKINDEVVTKEQFTVYYNNAYERAQAEQEQMAQFGYPAQPINAKELLDTTIQNVIKDKALHQKAHELKLDEYTPEELAEMNETAKANYQSILDQVKLYYFSDTTLEGEELEEAIKKQTQGFGFTEDLMLENAKETKIHDNLLAYAGRDIEITDEEIKAAYDEKVKAEQEEYTANPAAYGDKATGGQLVYYTPGGYRYVRQILLPLLQEDQNTLRTLQSEVTTLQTALNTAQAEVTRYEGLLTQDGTSEEDVAFVKAQAEALGEDAARYTELLEKEGLSEEESKELAELKGKTALSKAVADAQAALDAKQAEVVQKEEEAFNKIQAKTDEVYAAATAEGADFDALAKENDNDPGQPAQGYAVSASTTTFVPAFTEGAMALENIGDISSPIKTNYGYHILKYVEDIKEGPVALDSVKETLKKELFEARQEEVYTTLEAQWLSEFKVESYPERMSN